MRCFALPSSPLSASSAGRLVAGQGVRNVSTRARPDAARAGATGGASSRRRRTHRTLERTNRGHQDRALVHAADRMWQRHGVVVSVFDVLAWSHALAKAIEAGTAFRARSSKPHRPRYVIRLGARAYTVGWNPKLGLIATVLP